MSESSQLKQLLLELKNELIDLHRKSHNIIYNRVDIEKPLKSIDVKKINELDLAHHRVSQKIKACLLEIKLDDHKKETVTYPELKLTEFQILNALGKTKAEYTKIPYIQRNLFHSNQKMGRTTITKHLRTLVVAGFAAQNEYQYRITTLGLEVLDYNEKIRKIINAI